MNKQVITWGEVLDVVGNPVAAEMVKRDLIVRRDGRDSHEVWLRTTVCTFPLPKSALRRHGARGKLIAACRSLVHMYPEDR